MLVWNRIRMRAATHPDKLAMACGDVRLTYAQFAEQAERLAHAWLGQGLQPGDRIAQLVLEQILMANPTVKDSLPQTTRGTQGFGSTGNSTLLSTASIGLLKRIQFDEDFLDRVRATTTEDPEYRKFIQTKPEDKDRQILDGLIYFKNRLQIPNHEGLRLEIAQSEHDSQVAGHFGQKKTLELISRNFHWPNLNDWVNQYVRSCDTCQ